MFTNKKRTLIAFFFCLVAGLPVIGKALAAVDRLVAARLEGNLCFLSAVSANCSEHLAGAVAILLGTEGRTALRATARLILEAFLRIKLLLCSCENKFFAAVTTSKGLVLVHFLFPPQNDNPFPYPLILNFLGKGSTLFKEVLWDHLG